MSIRGGVGLGLATVVAACGASTPTSGAAPVAATQPIAVEQAAKAPGIATAPRQTVAPTGTVADDPTLWAVGDLVNCGSATSLAVAKLVNDGSSPMLALGDLAYPDATKAQFQCFDADYGSMKSRILPVIGNHEWHQPGANTWKAYFGRKSGNYTATVGAWKIIVLDSDCDKSGGLNGICGVGSPTYNFLKAQLANAPACTAVAYHHPALTAGRHRADSKMTLPLWKLITANHVELVLNGHDHMYERFAPVNGTVEIVSGAGGASHYSFTTGSPQPVARNNSVFGAVKLSLTSSGWTSRFVAANGQASYSDTASAGCH